MSNCSPIDKPRTLVLPPAPYAAAIAGGWWLDRNFLSIPLDFGPITKPLAVLAVAAGLGLMAWTLWVFRRHQTTINPYAGAKHLCISGPFRFSRNPIYVGDWLILIGLSLWFSTFWPILVSPLVWVVVRYSVIRHEEEHLQAKFGEEYRAYKERVRRWL